MQSYVCLLLDEACHVILATIVRGTIADVTEAMKSLNREKAAWGYEIWADDHRVAASYECESPPGRVARAG